LFRLTGLFLMLSGAMPASAAEEPVLNFYNWADYIGETTLADFRLETGISVNYDTFDATPVVEAKLLAGQTGYDVVLHAARYSARLIEVGAFLPLDRDQLPHWHNLDPWVLGQLEQFDPGNRYAMPYMWGTIGFAYNVRLIRERMPNAPVESSRMLFDPQVAARFADCGISLLDSPTSVIPMALAYLGHDPVSIEPDELRQAEKALLAIRPYIRYFSSSRMMIDLPNEEICIAMSWSGDYKQAELRAAEVGRDIELAYTAPIEGTLYFFDSLLIPADAPHPGNAHRFLDFLMRPEVIAPITNLLRYANGNSASLPLLDGDLVGDPASYPTMEMRENWKANRIYSPKQERLRSRIWSRVKAGL
jgi:putrescine transport system substrate-binding protein